MKRTPADAEKLRREIAQALTAERLNAWQRRFLSDMAAKFDREGAGVLLTAKQEAKLRETLGHKQQAKRPPDRASPRANVVKMRPRVPAKKPVRQPRTGGRMLRRARNRAVWQVRQMLMAVGGMTILALASISFQDNPHPARTPVMQSTAAASLSRSDITVVDGDTIQLRGEAKSIRLVGFNTPETYKPVCRAGLDLGRRATARLKQMVGRAEAIQLDLVPCACLPQDRGTSRCNFGRSCGRLRIDGADVGRTLIAEGLAARFVCGATSCPPLPRPWCNGG